MSDNHRIEIYEHEFLAIKDKLLELNNLFSKIQYTTSKGHVNVRVPFTDEEKNAIITLIGQGKNTYQIAKTIRRPFNSVKNFLKANPTEKST